MTTKPTTPAALTWRGATARRMARHALTEPATGLGPAGIAGVLCGAHAQVLSAAELSIGRRIADATRSDVQRALWQERTLVKTFAITVEPLRELTASQRRQLDDEVDLVGAVMEAPATLTVGTVTVGAHA